MLKLDIGNQIYSILAKHPGRLFFTSDFAHLVDSDIDAIKKVLSRLAKNGDIKRIARGIYYKPRKDPVIGDLTPGIEEVAAAIARHDKAGIVPSGAYALNRLGLSTQIPMNIVFLTEGSSRQLKIGNKTITFRKTAPRNVAAKGKISRLAIQALKSIGKDQVTEKQKNQILRLLAKENKKNLEHDIRLAPEWVRKIMRPALKEL